MRASKLERFAELLSETNLYISAAAGLLVGSTYWMFGLVADTALVSAVFFATLFTYNFQRRIGDLEGPGQFRKVKGALMVLALCGLLPSLYFLSFATLAVLGLAGALSLGYAYPFLKWGGRQISLRQVPHAKIWIILVVWMLACVVCPFVELGKPRGYDERLSLLFIFAQQGSLVFALTLCFDIRDLPHDDQDQKTIPMRIGVDSTLNLARIATSVSLFGAFANYFIGYYSAAVVLVHFAAVVASRLLFKKVSPERGKLFYTIYIDGIIILLGLGMYLTFKI